VDQVAAWLITQGYADDIAQYQSAHATSMMGTQNMMTSPPKFNVLEYDYIHTIEISPPPKATMLAYLYPKEGEAPTAYPGRFAVVVIHRGKSGPDVKEYRVGPLGPGAVLTAVQTNEFLFNDRQLDGWDWDMCGAFVLEPAFEKLRPMLDEEWGKEIVYNRDNHARLRVHISAPPDVAVGHRVYQVRTKTWVAGTARGDDLTPLPLDMYIEGNGNDPTKWSVVAYWYINQGPFATAEELMEAYFAGTIKTWRLPDPLREYRANTDWVYAGRRDEPYPAPGMDKKDTPGPTTYMPAGHRFTYDTDTGYLTWLGWRLVPGATWNRGPYAYDATFRGHRVIYEAALQEVAVVYSANNPVTANVMFLDAQYGLGGVPNVIDGVDCPSNAAYLPFSYWRAGGHGDRYERVTMQRAFCVFEWDTGTPLWRRRDLDAWAGGQREVKLVVRTAFTVGNYDYVISIELGLDGAFRLLSDTTGYLQTYFFDETSKLHVVQPAAQGVGSQGSITGDDSVPQGEDPFANRVQDYTNAALHDHTVSIKLDVDIIDESNAFRKTTFGAGEPKEIMHGVVPDDAENPPYLLYWPMRYATRDIALTEADALLRHDPVHPVYWEFINQAQKNTWGHPKGYRLTLRSDHYQVLPDNHPFMGGCPERASYNAATWTSTVPNAGNCSGKRGSGAFTKYNLAVLQRKEDEPVSTGRVDANRMSDPEVSLDDFIDGESIVDEDLVAWISYSNIHLPIVEDKPMTNMVHMGIVFKPANFADENEALYGRVDIFPNTMQNYDSVPDKPNQPQVIEVEPAREAANCAPTVVKVEEYVCGWPNGNDPTAPCSTKCLGADCLQSQVPHTTD
jgi:diamine oxidase